MLGAAARDVRHAFDLEAKGPLEIKGKSEPVPAYRVLGPKKEAGSKRGIAGLQSPIVGREREIGLLSGRLKELAGGAGQILAIVGEAGLGKSRLVAEVIQRSPETFLRAEGHCISFASAIPYAPIIEILENLLDLRAAPGPEARLAVLRKRLPPAGLPFIATLLGLPLAGDELDAIRFLGATEPGQLRERLLGALCAAFEHLACITPLAIIVEDLHWADSSTLELLERLMASTERAPLAVVAAFRPEPNEPSWRFHEVATRDHAGRYTPVFLQPLSEAGAQSLVSNLLYIEDLPEAVRALILKKAEGNPFYVEEIIRSLLDAQLVVRANNRWRATQEIANIALPDSLAGVITARLDRLDDEAKAAAQTAAVLG